MKASKTRDTNSGATTPNNQSRVIMLNFSSRTPVRANFETKLKFFIPVPSSRSNIFLPF